MVLKFFISYRTLVVLLLSLTYISLEAVTHTVETIADDATTPPVGSLRAALLAANAGDTIAFAITDGGAQQVKTITLADDLPPITKNNISIDGIGQDGAVIGSPVVVIDCNGKDYGFHIIDASNCEIKNLVINNSPFDLIRIEYVEVVPNGNKVLGCFLGTDATGMSLPGVVHSHGITLIGTTNTVIGVAGHGNLIANATNVGIGLYAKAKGTDIKGNSIGVNKTGTAPMGNGAGIYLSGDSVTDYIEDTIIGGSGTQEGNIIAGNGYGIQANFLYNSSIVGNLIGTVDGINPLQNTADGINVYNLGNCVIGGALSAARNIIAANGARGIHLFNGSDIVIQGNYIGTGIMGEEDLGNGAEGINIDSGSNNSIIGNVIGNNTTGLVISSVGNSLQGNFIGTNSAGIINLGNTGNGITVNDSNNKIGGLLSTDYNTIAYNDGYGVSVSAGILNSILGNAIYNNTNSGIFLTPGGNADQAVPTIVSTTYTDYTPSNRTVTVTAQAPSLPTSSTFRLEFFLNDSNRSPIGDGKKLIGVIDSVSTGAEVTETFVVDSSAAGKFLSATATNLNAAAGAPGDTSILSDNQIIVNVPAPAVMYTVITADDSGVGSLRTAIESANSTPGAIIEFNIPGDGVHTITLLSKLPSITADGTIIDGLTQPGATVGNPVVVINGNGENGGSDYGFHIKDASNCEIKNLVINNASYLIEIQKFSGAAENNKVLGCFLGTDATGMTAVGQYNFFGIIIDGGLNTIIGGGTTGEGNLIANTQNAGILVYSPSNGTVIKGNHIGTNKAGTAPLANGIGIQFFGSSTDRVEGITIGGAGTQEGNIISGNTTGISGFLYNSSILGNVIGATLNGGQSLPNTGDGISLVDSENCTIGGGTKNIISSNGGSGIRFSNTINSTISGNYIGTGAVTGIEELGNGSEGILLESTSLNNTILDNVIVNNTGPGLSIHSTGNTVQGNFIGTNSTGVDTLGNADNGVTITGSDNMIGGINSAQYNTIAFNGGYGVSVSEGTLNSILGNSIYNNENPGIMLTDGGNNGQLPPAIQSFTLTDTTITITAQAPLLPDSSNFRLEFFVNDENRNGKSITDGQTFIGAVQAVSGEEVIQEFVLTSPLAGRYLSATATNLNNTAEAFGDTSMLGVIVENTGIVSQTMQAISAKYY